MTTLKEIERAIDALTPEEFEELRQWMEQSARPQPIDLQLKADLDAGRMDKLIEQAVQDYSAGRTKPL
jgi:hypothetical protein